MNQSPGQSNVPALTGTGNGGSAAVTWTAADRQNLIVIVGLIVIILVLIAALMIVQEPGIRTNLVVMISAGIGALGGVLRGGQLQQHNTQGIDAANVETVSVTPPAVP